MIAKSLGARGKKETVYILYFGEGLLLITTTHAHECFVVGFIMSEV